MVFVEKTKYCRFYLLRKYQDDCKSNNGGEKWIKINNGLPNISVRDIAIQKNENDLILGTFGRGIYILDDYSPLRNFNFSDIKTEAKLFSPQNTNWYFEKRILGSRKKASQGDNKPLNALRIRIVCLT